MARQCAPVDEAPLEGVSVWKRKEGAIWGQVQLGAHA